MDYKEPNSLDVMLNDQFLIKITMAQNTFNPINGIESIKITLGINVIAKRLPTFFNIDNLLT